MNATWRKRLLLTMGVAVLCLVGSVYLFAPADRISTYGRAQIREGMTQDQVEALLGGPPGDYRTPPLRKADNQLISELPPGKQWQGDRCSIYVLFDANDRVGQVTCFFPGKMRPSWYRGIQQWLPFPD